MSKIKYKIGDCLELLKDIPDESIDLVLTDPPYNAGKRYGLNYDDKKPIKEYISLLRSQFEEMSRALIEGGSLVFTYNCCGLENLGYLLPKSLNPIRVAVWHKPFSPSPFKGTGWSWHWEPIVWWAKGKPKCRGTWTEPDVISFNPVCRALKSKEFNEHPCQKPLALWKYLIKRFSKEGDTVLDPFLGSGTTLVACQHLNRNGKGFEINPEYEVIIRHRLKLDIKNIESFS